MNIHYFYEDVDFRLSHKAAFSDWIHGVIRSHGFESKEINYIFCSDDYLLEINKQHLDHDYHTDIITFDNSEQENSIESDIFISIDRVKENANEYHLGFENELSRIMIHGILHLLGFGDKTRSDQKVMREKEDTCLSLLKKQCST